MKKILSVLIFCIVLVGLCACGARVQNEPSTQATTLHTISIEYETVPPFNYEVPTVEIPTSPEDPYSSIIKKRYLNFFRYNINPKGDIEHKKYALHDIDGNGTDELILGTYQKLGHYEDPITDETEFDMIIENVYTIIDGKAEMQGVPNWWTVVYGFDVLSNGVLRLRGGGWSNLYSHFVNGKLEYYGILTGGEDGSFMHCYVADGVSKDEKITKAEYDRLKKEIEGDGTVVKLDWKRYDEYKPMR